MTKSDQDKLATVAPDLAAAFPLVASDFAAEFPGSTLGVANGYRTPKVQANASSAGASPFDGETSFSLHQRLPSDALDFVVRDPAAPSGWVKDGSDPRYGWVGNAFKERGFVWGGTWHVPDYGHVQRAGVSMPTKVEVVADYNDYLNLEGQA